MEENIDSIGMFILGRLYLKRDMLWYVIQISNHWMEKKILIFVYVMQSSEHQTFYYANISKFKA